MCASTNLQGKRRCDKLKVEIDVIVNLCERALERKGMPEDWKTCVLVPIYKGKGDVTNYKAYTCRKVKLLEHGTKIIKRVLEKKIRALVVVDDMQFGFMPGRGTTDERRMQQEYRKKVKNCTCVL